jgi:basic amino acid/polyamine antiporter, APA family
MTALDRRLGVRDAVVIGLGSMLGAGVFVVFAPAAALAGGGGMLAALGIAGLVALCNATSSARLAVRYPESGGTYVYGRERLGDFWGYLAGWGFVVGKTASCGAMALTIGAYLWPSQSRVVAVLAVVALTAVNLFGIAKTALATRLLVLLTVLVIAFVVVVGIPASSTVHSGVSWPGVLPAAGLLFFAFAGYARIATLGEEVRDPARTIPRAVPLALGIVLLVYLAVGVVALAVLGPSRLAHTSAPLADVVSAAGVPGAAWVVRIGAGVAVVGVLLALIAGVGRTTLAMARRRDLPGFLDAVHPRFRVPYRAEIAVAVAVVVLVSLVDLRGAIGFSSVTVLVYYAIANASAVTLPRGDSTSALTLGRDRLGSASAALGLVGCLVLAATLPWRSTVAGFVVLAVGAFWYLVRPRRRHA